ncbi:MAG: hypothetical protein ISR65_07220 [Bacteriovoracaceae bacterium]|nr:hypothetical protein [Bacteriovoracaceae bacterium]
MNALTLPTPLINRLPISKVRNFYRHTLERKYYELDQVMQLEASGKKHTIIVISSISIDPRNVENITGVIHYESRALWETLKASSKNTSIIYITSVPIDQKAIDHLLNFLPNPKEARKRIKFMALNDDSTTKCLSVKILENREFIRILKSHFNKLNTYLTTFVVSKDEMKLAQRLGVPLLGTLPHLEYFKTKSGNRQIFQESKIKFADGVNNIADLGQLISAVRELWARHPDAKRFLVKLNTGVSGDGNAILNLTANYQDLSKMHVKAQIQLIYDLLANLQFQSKALNFAKFLERLSEGAIIETYIEGQNKTSPSAQLFIHADGTVEMLSTHEQILDHNGQTFLGSIFPARSEYRQEISKTSKKIGHVMSKHGIRGVCAVDFLCVKNGDQCELWAIEVNIRQGGTTHPYRTAKFLTNSNYDENSGKLKAQDGSSVFYMSNDNILNSSLKGTKIDTFLAFMQHQGVLFDKSKNTGVVFHLLGALHDHGKIGYTAIGTTQASAHHIFDKTLKLVNDFCKR